MDLGIAKRRALVLGASRGLGAATAAALAKEGVEVIAAARNTDALVARGQRAISVDLSDPGSVQSLIDQMVAEGGVDILINNGGGPKPGTAEAMAGADWNAAFAAMALPLFAITGAMLPLMIKKGWGRIVTIGSSGVVQPIGGLVLSNGVRGAVAGWSKTLAGEVARHGITVNMVLPGRIDTDRVRALDQGRAERTGNSVEAVAEAARAEIPAGRYGRPEEFAAAVAFLASAQASYITGVMLAVDGGSIKGL